MFLDLSASSVMVGPSHLPLANFPHMPSFQSSLFSCFPSRVTDNLLLISFRSSWSFNIGLPQSRVLGPLFSIYTNSLGVLSGLMILNTKYAEITTKFMFWVKTILPNSVTTYLTTLWHFYLNVQHLSKTEPLVCDHLKFAVPSAFPPKSMATIIFLDCLV